MEKKQYSLQYIVLCKLEDVPLKGLDSDEEQNYASQQQTANSKQQTANSKQQTANSKQQTAQVNCALFASCGALETEYSIRDG